MGLLSDLSCGRLASADGPHGFVGYKDFAELLYRNAFKPLDQLFFQNFVSLARFAFFFFFTNFVVQFF